MNINFVLRTNSSFLPFLAELRPSVKLHMPVSKSPITPHFGNESARDESKDFSALRKEQDTGPLLNLTAFKFYIQL